MNNKPDVTWRQIWNQLRRTVCAMLMTWACGANPELFYQMVDEIYEIQQSRPPEHPNCRCTIGTGLNIGSKPWPEGFPNE